MSRRTAIRTARGAAEATAAAEEAAEEEAAEEEAAEEEAAEEEAAEEEQEAAAERRSCCWAASEPMWPPLLLLFAESEDR
jgi:predicted Rossmann fold nucleotide-binding protein DprA/Smf involved in DNA uptake